MCEQCDSMVMVDSVLSQFAINMAQMAGNVEGIENFTSKIDRLDFVKDLFIFSSYTGLSYIDIMQLKNDNILITIDDDGHGIPEKEYQNVFKPFYKLDKSRGDSKSSVGLGLSITSDIVKSHGGNIVLEKSPLNGLRVKVFLPL